MVEFLKVVSYQEAQLLLKQHFPPAQIANLPLESCNRRVLAHDIKSPENIPSFNRSTVDGYAVRAEDTFGSSESLPGMLMYKGEIKMGRPSSIEVGASQCAWIPTGGMLPAGTNAVVMVEYTEKLGEDTILISRPVAPGENVMYKGEDIASGQTVFQSGKALKAQEIGLLASLGIESLPVYEPLHIGILSTGDEIIPLNQIPSPGQVRDVNSYSLEAALESCGAVPHRYPLVKDDVDSLRQAVERALQENAVLIMSGGSSVGVADYSIDVMLSFPDSKLLFHGIAVKPGKPTIGVKVGKKLIVGLPGHPVSALMVFYILCSPLINPIQDPPTEAVIDLNIASQPGRDDFVPVRLISDENGLKAKPLLGKSGLMSILAQADGYIHIPYEKQGIKTGDTVKVNLF